MFPVIDIGDLRNEEDIKNDQLGKTFLFDFKKNEFVLKDGKPVEIENKSAIKMWVEKLIKTEKFKFNVYKENEPFGTTIKNFALGKKYPSVFIESEIKRELTEELIFHPKIDDCLNWEIKINRSTLEIKFDIILKTDETVSLEVELR